jgi:hypothetical protein
VKKLYDAIRITEKGVYTGILQSKNNQEGVFVNHGFIPNNQIQKIMFFGETGKSTDIDFKKTVNWR